MGQCASSSSGHQSVKGSGSRNNSSKREIVSEGTMMKKRKMKARTIPETAYKVRNPKYVANSDGIITDEEEDEDPSGQRFEARVREEKEDYLVRDVVKKRGCEMFVMDFGKSRTLPTMASSAVNTRPLRGHQTPPRRKLEDKRRPAKEQEEGGRHIHHGYNQRVAFAVGAFCGPFYIVSGKLVSSFVVACGPADLSTCTVYTCGRGIPFSGSSIRLFGVLDQEGADGFLGGGGGGLHVCAFHRLWQ